MNEHSITVTVNGRELRASVEARRSLADFLRNDLRLTGTHVGCEHGACGACTVQVDGEAVRSCLMLAVQVDGRTVRTVEALGSEEALSPLQEAFRQTHALQCGFCTPGVLMPVDEFLAAEPDATETEIREALSGNVCRCTGYQAIVEAVRLAARTMRQGERG